jgi:hypothetical protein
MLVQHGLRDYSATSGRRHCTKVIVLTSHGPVSGGLTYAPSPDLFCAMQRPPPQVDLLPPTDGRERERLRILFWEHLQGQLAIAWAEAQARERYRARAAYEASWQAALCPPPPGSR